MENELTHWGIRGMKWGQRRYQNKDGSLTPAGKKRYQKEMEALKKEEAILKNRKATQAKIDRLEAKRKSIEEQKKALDGDDAEDKKGKAVKDKGEKKVAAKSVKDMTDEELATAINRARMEDTYRQLRPEQQVEKSPLMKKMLNDVVMPAATTAGKQFLQNALTKAGENLLKDKVDPNSIEALTKIRDKLKLQKEIEKIKSGKSDDDDLSWGDRIKKQTWERNQKKYAEEDAAEESAKAAADKAERLSKQRAAEEARRTNAGHKEFINRTTDEPNIRKSASERAQKNVNDNIDWDDWDSSDGRKVFTGTVEGVGKSSRTSDKGKQWTRNNDVIDADTYELATTTNVRSGQAYLSDRWDDYVWVD